MKACPFCAEEIQDAAIKCRHCGSDLTGEPGRSDASRAGNIGAEIPGDAVERPQQLTHMGRRYGLGTTADAYGIWDIQAPGEPVHRFDLTDQGWLEAWATYSRLEPTGKPTGSQAWSPASPAPGPPVGERSSGIAERTVPVASNGTATASLVLGIIALVFGFFPVVGLALGVFALVLGFMGLKRADLSGTGRGLAVAGLVLGAIATVIGLLVVAVFGQVADEMSRIKNELDGLQ